MRKYLGITEQELNKGIQDGIFKEDGTLIRHKNGEIVKIRKNISNQNFPSTLFQLTNITNINQTIIYQTDIRPFIDALIEEKNIELIENLKILYVKTLDTLEHYKSYNDGLKDLNKCSRDSLSEFESLFKKEPNEINKDNLTMFNSYINILFIYMISTYKLYKKNISKDTIIKNKITNLEKTIRYLYEQKLAKSNFSDNTNYITMNNSLYAKFLLKDSTGIEKINKYIKYDSRFKSFSDFMEFIKKFIKKDYNSNNYYINIDIEENNNYRLIPKNKKQNDGVIAAKLFDILEKIESFKNIYKELIEISDIDSNEVKSYLSDDKSFELLVIN